MASFRFLTFIHDCHTDRVTSASEKNVVEVSEMPRFLSFFLSFYIYCLALAFEHYRQVYIVHSGLQDESLQVTISKLP